MARSFLEKLERVVESDTHDESGTGRSGAHHLDHHPLWVMCQDESLCYPLHRSREAGGATCTALICVAPGWRMVC